MLKAPKVSILVPAYKMEQYLVECLDSIVNQTLDDIEIIVIDEGDQDECRAIIDTYEFGIRKDARIKTIHEKNGGYGASMNKGINLAKGEYIGIVEADDFVDKNMFKDLYELAIANDADIVKSDFYAYTTSKNQSRKSGKISKLLDKKVTNIKKMPELLKMQPTIWTAIYKREFLNSNSIRFLETAGGSYQDTSFAFKTLALAKNIVLTSKAYLHYRIDNELSSVKSKGKVFAICDEYEELTKFVNSHPELEKIINPYKIIKQYNAYMWNLKRIAPEFRPEFIERFADEFKMLEDNGQLTSVVYKKVNKKHVQMLLKAPEKFVMLVGDLVDKQDKRQKRNKMFSININLSRVSIVLFGKQILAIDF